MSYTTILQRLFSRPVHGYNFRRKNNPVKIIGILIVLISLFFGAKAIIIKIHAKTVGLDIQEGKSLLKENPSSPEDAFSFDVTAKGGSGLNQEQVSHLLSGNSLHFNSPVQSIAVDNSNTLQVHYTIDTSLIQYIDKLLNRYHPKYGAIAVIEPATGRILALNSYTRDDVPSIGENLYLRNIFPSASIFKIITAAAAIEVAGLNSESPLFNIGPNHTLYHYQIKEDINRGNEFTLDRAFAKSINPIFGRLGLWSVGINRLTSVAHTFGFNMYIPFEFTLDPAVFTPSDSNYTIAELASGFNRTTSISPIFGSMIAGTISMNGQMYAPTVVDKIINTATNETIYRSEPRLLRTVLKSETCAEMQKIMHTVVVSGTARKSFRHFKPRISINDLCVGGKTGNINKEELGRVDWFVGFCKNKLNPQEHIAVGVVTVHDAYWTIHSSYLAEEIFRIYLKNCDINSKKITDTVPLLSHGVNDADSADNDESGEE